MATRPHDEASSGPTRQDWARDSSNKLPRDHEGRNSWPLNYGVGAEAERLRSERGVRLDQRSNAVPAQR
jgi:hypothetical protein